MKIEAHGSSNGDQDGEAGEVVGGADEVGVVPFNWQCRPVSMISIIKNNY